MDNIVKYLQDEEYTIREEIENVLRNMCFGTNREWSDEMIDKLYKEVYEIIGADLYNLSCQGKKLNRLVVTGEMVITAMMRYIEKF